jgi:hypothetical protein
MERAARERNAVGTPAAEAAFAIATSTAFREQPWAAWRAPERLMTNVHLLYQEFAGNTAPLGAATKINLMRKQALLARALSGADGPRASGSEVD